ncbi:MAG: GIY-YIG nuclease family protein [Bacteroidia bacterium]|nr:GIY-YIG nuclease family protein [Bacteroidia bacterium]
MNIDEELKSIFSDPLLEHIEQEDLSLFDVPETLKKSTKDNPDYIAQRTLCENFHDYEDGFKKVHQELKSGKRNIKKLTKSRALQAGSYYITGGVLLFLEQIGEWEINNKRKKKDARTRCIYENGTESDIYLDTLRKSITTDGYVVTESTESDEAFLQSQFGVTSDDIQDGWIYVLSSLSENPEIKSQKNLYKIGFSTTPVEERIKNAQNDATYLMDKVKIEASWKTFNMNTQKFENLIHQFFSAVQFNFLIEDKSGVKKKAREWYVVPMDIIETVINRFIDKSIVHYRYNPSLESLEYIEPANENTKPKFDTTGLKVLTLNIKKIYFDEIIAGNKDIEFRELKQTTLNRYTWISNEDGKRYLKKYDVIRFYVGYNRDRASALVEVIDTTYNSDSRFVEYHLGRVLEKNMI